MTSEPTPRRNWIDRLPDTARHAVAQAMVRRHYPAGTLLYSRNDPPEGLYLIRSGSVLFSLDGATGQRLVLNILHPGELFGEAAAFDGGPAFVTVEARAKLVVDLVPAFRLMRLNRDHPSIGQALARVAAANLRGTLARLQEQALMALPERIVARLTTLCARAGGASPILLDLTQTELAAMLGASRQAINRELARLERAGIIRRQFRALEVWPERFAR